MDSVIPLKLSRLTNKLPLIPC